MISETKSKLFARAILSSMDSRLFNIATDFVEYLEPRASQYIETEACIVLDEITEIINDKTLDSVSVVDKISSILNSYHYDRSK